MSSFFYTKNKYIISFNHEDLVKKNINPILTECINNLKKEDKVYINIVDAKDIKVENLLYLIEFVIMAKKTISEIYFSISDELKILLKETNLYKLFIKDSL